jgi:membrane protein DedA with SNARE-associated domain
VDVAHRWFSRYGRWAILTGRVVPVIRGYISFPAGLTGVPIRSFSALTVAGSLPWCAALAAAGYLMGAHYDEVSDPVGKAAIVLGALAVTLLVGWFLRGRACSETPCHD